MLSIEAIDHLVFNVRDVDVSADWYERVLGMHRQVSPSPAGDRTSMMFGSNKINLRPVDASQDDWFTAEAPAAGSVDLCFLTATSPPDVAAHMRRLGIGIVLGPARKSGARGPIRSVYVRDPDGNLIEVSSYIDR